MAARQRQRDDKNAQLEHLAAEFNAMLQIRRLWEPVWQEIANHIRPMKNDIIVRKSPGVRRTEKLFNSTAIFASELLAASLHGTLTSSYNRWFGLILDDPQMMVDADTQTWLSDCAEDMRLAVNRSNFAQESHEGYLDIVDFGHFVLLLEDREDEGKKGELRFNSVQIQNSVIGEDGLGRVNRVHRNFPLTRSAILERWPNADYSETDIDNPDAKGTDPFEVIHSVVPSQDNKSPSLTRPGWLSIYFLRDAAVRLEVDTFHEFPYMVPRWTKTTGETYGRGRGHTALPDVKSLNKIVELELRSLGKHVDPPLVQIGGDVIGQVHLQRGGLTTIRTAGAVAPLYTSQVDFQPVNLKVVELEDKIKKMFYADQLQMPSENPQMTATEANIRYELMQRILGPTLGRLEAEYLSPLIRRIFAIRQRAGLLPDPPAIVADAMNGQTRRPRLSISYEGPLARAQKSGDVSAVTQLIQTTEPLQQVLPNLLTDNIDMDGLIRDTARSLGIKAAYIKSDKEVEEAQDERQQAQQAQADQEAQNEKMKAAGSLGSLAAAAHKAPEPGSIADQATGGQAGAQGGQTQTNQG